MKKEIEEILDQNLGIGNFDTEVIGISEAAEELQGLMCYREVRAFKLGYYAPEWPIWVQQKLKQDYPELMILEAIEKVKKEQQ